MQVPRGTNLMSWARSLIIDYPADNIPILMDEKQWREWGYFLIQSNSFAKVGASSPATFKDWLSWASDLYRLLNSYD